MDKRNRIIVELVVVVVAAAGLLIWWQQRPGRSGLEDQPEPIPIRPAVDTTWLTQPLHPDGTVNYIARVNEKYGQGIRPEDNAASELLICCAPPEVGPSQREILARRMGLQVAPSAIDFPLPLIEYPTRPSTDDSSTRLLSSLRRASHGPWDPSEHPELREWIEKHGEALDRLARAGNKPRLFIPLYSRLRPERLAGAERPYAEPCLQIIHSLAARGALRARTGEFDKAREDYIAALRWCRLVSQSMVTSEATHAYRLGQRVYEATMASLAQGRWKAGPAGQLLEQMRSLPALRSPLETANWDQRLSRLDAMQVCAVDGLARGMGLLSDQYEIQGLQDTGTNYNSAMRQINHWYDRYLRVAAMPDSTQRDRAARQVADLWTQFRTDVYRRRVQKDGSLAPTDTVDVVVHLVVRNPLYLVEYPRPQYLNARNMAWVAAALARHKAERGAYPDSLEALVPQILPSLPDDPYGQGPLRYRHTGGNALLYSVGPNGRDDNGQSSLQQDLDDISLKLR